MTERFGQFVWYELMTGDVPAALEFYKAVVGWEAQTFPDPAMDYTLFRIPGEAAAVGGAMTLQPIHEEQGIPPNWTGYIEVDDVDLVCADIVMLGGAVRRQPDEIPGVGRFAVAADPQGAVFIIFRPTPMDEPPPPLLPHLNGTIGWHELYCGDPQTIFPFYEKLFGWEAHEVVDAGVPGEVLLFSIRGGICGSIARIPEGMTMPFWTFYVTVDSLERAAATVTEQRGKVLLGPVEIPGGSEILHCLDPQGAFFSLVAGEW